MDLLPFSVIEMKFSLRRIVAPYILAIGYDLILMDENWQSHRVNLLDDFLLEEGRNSCLSPPTKSQETGNSCFGGVTEYLSSSLIV